MNINHLTALNLSATINALMNMEGLDIRQIQEETRCLFFHAKVEFIAFEDFKTELNSNELLYVLKNTEDWFFEKINNKAIDCLKIYELLQKTTKPKS
jgi:hypothetical protein